MQQMPTAFDGPQPCMMSNVNKDVVHEHKGLNERGAEQRGLRSLPDVTGGCRLLHSIGCG